MGMVLPDQIPVYVLSGFLGSGKSTLLNALLRDPEFGDTAVIINEFGDVPVDHLLVREGETTINQVATGCLCCSGTTDLRATLFDLHCAGSAGLCPPFSRVIVEMSGLGDPAPLVNALNPAQYAPTPYTLRDRTVDTVFHLAGVVTLYDILTGPLALEHHFEAVKQIAFADRIVLTKTDLAKDPASRRDLAALPAELAELNTSAAVLDKGDIALSDLFVPRHYTTVDRGEDVAGWLALEAVLASEAAHHDPDAARNLSSVRHGTGINTFSIVREAPIPEKRFRRFLAFLQSAAGSRLLRVKGLVGLEDDPDRPRIVHAVQHITSEPQILDTWPDEDRRTRLVFIMKDIDPERVRAIFAALIDGRRFSFSDAVTQLFDQWIAPFKGLVERFTHSPRKST